MYILLVTHATDLSLRAIKCCSVVFGVTLRLLVINISLATQQVRLFWHMLLISGSACRHGMD